jgi:uncharacterized protein YcaQ
VTLAVADVRRLAVAAQGYASRDRVAGSDRVAAEVRRLSAVQLDSISAVERAHRLTLLSRVGRYPRGSVSALLAAGRLFEYWAHEACLLPIEDWPLWRSRMLASPDHPWWGSVVADDPRLADRVMGEIRERGPLGSRHFEGTAAKGMWNQKPAKRMLEALWSSGRLVIAGRQGFQRLYDLPERVIPDAMLGASLPGEAEFLRTIVRRAVRARGALTVAGVVEHWRLRGGVAAITPTVESLVADGSLRLHAVEDGGAPVLVDAAAPVGAAAPAGAVLLSPFDNLLWDRPFAERIIGFRHLIEVYKPAAERRYGYYVLPLVAGDRIAGRADVRADRRSGVLRLLAWHPERGRRRPAALDRAFARLARQLDLEPEAA